MALHEVEHNGKRAGQAAEGVENVGIYRLDAQNIRRDRASLVDEDVHVDGGNDLYLEKLFLATQKKEKI
jgi:hypothetical protein